MKFKLDENLGTRAQEIFLKSGHDIRTVREEGIGGASDEVVYKISQQEDRILVTLDLDFADVIRFPPRDSGGIVVLRLPRNPTLSMLESLIRQLLYAVQQENPKGRLWIVEPQRIRIHQSAEEEGKNSNY